MNIKRTEVLLFITTITLILNTGNLLAAESLCKKQSLESCASKDHCRWVESYIRKDNIVVKPYCRAATRKKVVTEKIINNNDAQPELKSIENEKTIPIPMQKNEELLQKNTVNTENI